MSKKPGLGVNYLTPAMKRWHKLNKANYGKVNGIVTRLPRIYKERIFTSIERARFAAEAVDIDTAAYRQAVEELVGVHHDPEGYYYERLCYLCERISHKENRFNKF